jgi:hypothetical protein
LNDQFKKDEMVRACSMTVRKRGMHMGFWWESKEKKTTWKTKTWVGG